MAETKSTEVTNLDARPVVLDEACDAYGKLRLLKFTYTQAADGSASDTVILQRIPAGRVNLLGALSRLYHDIDTAVTTFDIGWKAYTDLDGDAVAADADGLDDGIVSTTAGAVTVATLAALAATGQVKRFESRDGVDIILTALGGGIKANETLKGYLVIAVE